MMMILYYVVFEILLYISKYGWKENRQAKMTVQNNTDILTQFWQLSLPDNQHKKLKKCQKSETKTTKLIMNVVKSMDGKYK